MSVVSPSRRAPLRSAAMGGVGTALVHERACVGSRFAVRVACTDGPGSTIITDSPTQLSRCHPLTDRTVTPDDEREVPPRLVACCGLAWGRPRLGAPGLGG